VPFFYPEESIIAVAGRIDFISRGLKDHRQVVANVTLVIDNQNVNLRLSHWFAPLPPSADQLVS
jgi:hypothetical protein